MHHLSIRCSADLLCRIRMSGFRKAVYRKINVRYFHMFYYGDARQRFVNAIRKS